MEQVRIRHAYPIEYVPRSGRVTRKGWVAAEQPAAIATLPAAAAPVAVEMERVLKPYPLLNQNPETRSETFLAVGGGLGRVLPDHAGGPVGPGAFAGIDPAGPHGPWIEHGYPYQSGVIEGPVTASLAELMPRKVVSTGEAAAGAHVAAMAARTAVVDGRLVAPGPEPVWGIRQAHDCGVVQVAACLESEADTGMTFALFRADRLDRALAVAEALADSEGRSRPGKRFRVEVVGAITVHRPELLAFDEAAFNGMKRVLWAYRYPGSDGFAQLPLPALRAWIDFREAAGRLEAKEPGALMDCLGALNRMQQALPAFEDLDPDWKPWQAAAAIHRMTRALPAMMAFWEGDLASEHAHDDGDVLAASLGSKI